MSSGKAFNELTFKDLSLLMFDQPATLNYYANPEGNPGGFARSSDCWQAMPATRALGLASNRLTEEPD